MIRLALALCLLSLPALAGSQSLAETARKERERREELRKAGKSSRTLREADLASAQGQVANDPDSSGAPRAAAPEREVAEPASRPTRAGSADSRGEAEAYWRARVAEARARVERTQSRFRSLDRMIRIGQPAMYDEDGRRVMYSLRSLKKMADEVQAEAQAAEVALAELLEQARRAGALPGWLR